jgi:hypothetical protein
VSGVRFQVAGIRFQVSGFRCQVAGIRFQVSGGRLQVAGIRLQVLGIRGQEKIGILCLIYGIVALQGFATMEPAERSMEKKLPPDP